MRLKRTESGRPGSKRATGSTRLKAVGTCAEDVIGAVCYWTRWQGHSGGIEERLPYLKELGLSKYVHLNAFFKSPERENDGGVCCFELPETNPALGHHRRALLAREET